MTFDTLIIGGGLMGFSSALFLARRGMRCLVLEKDSPGRHASGVNAGGLRRLNRDPAEIPLAVAAAERWNSIREILDSDCDARFPGQIRVAENTQDMAILEQRANLVLSLGYDHEELIGQKELYEMLPALKKGCTGGLLCRGDGYARPFQALTAFRDKAVSLGVKYCPSTLVNNIGKNNGIWQISTARGDFFAPVLLNCAGAWANRIAEEVGDSIPLVAKAPMMMVTERLPHFIDPVVGATSRKLSFKQMQNGTLLIGGAHLANLDLDSQKTDINWRKLAVSARSVLSLFPQLENVRVVRTWAGIEGFTPDSLPVISASCETRGLFHCFGFSAHGFQLSPIVGQIMSELIVDGKTHFPIEPFNMNRFI